MTEAARRASKTTLTAAVLAVGAMTEAQMDLTECRGSRGSTGTREWNRPPSRRTR
jgi:hypothetical protein